MRTYMDLGMLLLLLEMFASSCVSLLDLNFYFTFLFSSPPTKVESPYMFQRSVDHLVESIPSAWL